MIVGRDDCSIRRIIPSDSAFLICPILWELCTFIVAYILASGMSCFDTPSCFVFGNITEKNEVPVMLSISCHSRDAEQNVSSALPDSFAPPSSSFAIFYKNVWLFLVYDSFAGEKPQDSWNFVRLSQIGQKLPLRQKVWESYCGQQFLSKVRCTTVYIMELSFSNRDSGIVEQLWPLDSCWWQYWK